MTHRGNTEPWLSATGAQTYLYTSQLTKSSENLLQERQQNRLLSNLLHKGSLKNPKPQTHLTLPTKTVKLYFLQVAIQHVIKYMKKQRKKPLDATLPLTKGKKKTYFKVLGI